jgi:FkbM family methyltransferase
MSDMNGTNGKIEYEFQGHKFYFHPTPQAQDLITEIFGDNYKVLSTPVIFNPGDVVLDIGACEGMFSIMLAKLFPEIKIIALEPVERTFRFLLQNIENNNVHNIEPHNFGVGKLEETKTIYVGLNDYSGGSSSYLTFDPNKQILETIKILPLDRVFEMAGIDHVKLLKIDTEGAEYEALYNSKRLKDFDFLVGEFHINKRLEVDGRRIDGLINWCSNRTKVLAIESCKMAE